MKSKKHGYTYQVDVRYKDPFGVTQRHVKSGFRNKGEAKVYESSIIEKVNSNIILTDSKRKTINDVFEEYMELEGENKYANATKFYYRKTHEQYVKNDFGKVPINNVNYANMQNHFNDLSKKYNYPTLKNIKKLFAITFKYGIREGYVSDNPVSNILLPDKPENKGVETINDDNLIKLISAVQKNGSSNYRAKKAEFSYKSYAMALVIGRYTGLRVSEVLALKKEDFDLENNRLTVQRRLEYAGLKRKDIYLTEKLKTKSSKSTVEISNQLTQYMKKWFDYNPYDLVICDVEGKVITPAAFQDRIRKVSKELGINFHYHMLRHTYTTELMMADINPIVVRDLLRHSKVNTTWNVYTHVDTKDQRKVLDEVYKQEEKSDLEIDLLKFQFKLK
ncbi:MAG: tyrosine-type recombinase/integrase [Thomasclavelia ramosa]